MAAFNLENYVTVQDRIDQFYQQFPEGSIRTFMVAKEGPEVIFEARVFRTNEEAETGVYTSGWSHEVEGRSPVNKTSFLENAETSAVGRALANLAFGTSAQRPSREEMMKVARVKEEHEELLEFIRASGDKVPADAVIEISGKSKNLKEFVRQNWTGSIKEQFRVARDVVDAMEAAMQQVEIAEAEPSADE